MTDQRKYKSPFISIFEPSSEEDQYRLLSRYVANRRKDRIVKIFLGDMMK